MKDFISRDKIVQLCAKTLTLYDDRLVEHGERVAYIALLIAMRLNMRCHQDLFEKKNLIILSVFHDCGAYKTEEIDRLVEFESTNVYAHSIYGYLFLKYFTPMEPLAKVILYHHTPSDRLINVVPEIRRYAELLHLADRADIAIRGNHTKEVISEMMNKSEFNGEMVGVFNELLFNSTLYDDLRSGEAVNYIFNEISKLPISADEAILYLKMLVYTIDFKSEYTVVHSVNTTVASLYLAWYCDFSREELERMYYAALIHDVGKIAIPTSILEFPGRLDDEQMEIMRKHVVYTEEILKDILPSEITTISARHHEKLNGKGYPHGLKGDELTKSDRVIAIADIISALSSRRSYKDAFAKEKILSILNEMKDAGELDPDIVNLAVTRYNDLEKQMIKNTAPIYQIYEDMQQEYADLIESEMFAE